MRGPTALPFHFGQFTGLSRRTRVGQLLEVVRDSRPAGQDRGPAIVEASEVPSSVVLSHPEQGPEILGNGIGLALIESDLIGVWNCLGDTPTRGDGSDGLLQAEGAHHQTSLTDPRVSAVDGDHCGQTSQWVWRRWPQGIRG